MLRKQIYIDTMGFHPAMIRAAIKVSSALKRSGRKRLADRQRWVHCRSGAPRIASAALGDIWTSGWLLAIMRASPLAIKAIRRAPVDLSRRSAVEPHDPFRVGPSALTRVAGWARYAFINRAFIFGENWQPLCDFGRCPLKKPFCRCYSKLVA